MANILNIVVVNVVIEVILLFPCAVLRANKIRKSGDEELVEISNLI